MAHAQKHSYKISLQIGHLHLILAHWSEPDWQFSPIAGFYELLYASSMSIIWRSPSYPIPVPEHLGGSHTHITRSTSP